jgi:hypothetical protein
VESRPCFVKKSCKFDGGKAGNCRAEFFKYKGKEARKLFAIAYQTDVKEEISLLPED